MNAESKRILEPDEDRIELRQVFGAVWRRKGMIFLLMTFCAGVFYAAVSQVTPQYTARASVMLDPRSVQVLSSDDVVSDLTLNNALLDTEVAVLRSNILLESVLAQIDPVLIAQIDPAAQPDGLVKRARAQAKAGVMRLRNWVMPVTEAAPAEVALVATIDPEAQRTRRLIGAMRRSLKVWREGQSYLIFLSFETPDPALSTTLANTLAETYIARQLDDRQTTVRSATAFLRTRVEKLRADVERAEAAVGDFRISQLAESGLSQTTIERQLLDLSTQLALARADLSQAQARSAQIENVVEEAGIDAAADLLTSPFVVSLRQQLSDLGRERADLSTRVGPDHPERQRVEAEISLISQELRAEVAKIRATIRNDVEVARSRVTSLQQSLAEMEGRSAAVSRSGVALRQLEREADAIRETYQTTLNRLNETRSAELLQRADARLVERAVVPGGASSPRVTLMTAFGGAIGMSIGLIATFVMALSNVGFKQVMQLERATGLPVLGTVLKVDWSNHPRLLRMLKRAPYAAPAERLRQLRTGLNLSGGGRNKGGCQLVTSSLANEGKTSTVLSLAQLEVIAGRSCVVLDLDLRKSRMARAFGYAQDTDLGDLLLHNRPLEEALYTVPEFGFDLLTLNKPMPGLMDRVTDGQWETLIADLKARYDLVLIDTAPVMLVSDTQRLVSLVDQVLLLVRQGETRQRAVLEATRKLEDSGARQIAAVMSIADPNLEKQTYGSYAAY